MHDVFISYSTANQAQADHIRQLLESAGIRCWYAPESLRGAQKFTDEIPEAIAGAKAFLLLMSEDAQKSRWVERELGEADDYPELPIFTFFLEDVTLNKSFRFMLRYSQHYPTNLGFEDQMNRLMLDLQKYIQRPIPKIEVTPLPNQKGPKKKLPLLLGIGAAVIAAVAAAVLLLGGGMRDGDYVIWNPAYGVALSGDVIHDYYHAGEEVLGQGSTLSGGYTSKSVWEVDFEGSTLTISRDGETLGVEPGQRGIGLGGDFTADRWELVDAGDGLYYIQNTETKFYLEWYDQKDNWAVHDKITNDNRDMFLVRIDPAK